MKDWIHQQTLIFLWIFLSYAFLIVLLGFTRELKLHIRKRINYHRFTRYVRYYEFTIQNLFLSIVYGFYFLSTLYAYFVVQDSEYNIYVLIIGLLDLLILPFVYLHVTSIHYNKNLNKYKEDYATIESSMENRKLLSDHIKNLEQMQKNMQDQNIVLNHDFSKYMKNSQGIDHLSDTLQPLKNVIEVYQEEETHFDQDVTKKFDKSLRIYIYTDKYITIPMKALKILDQKEIQTILSSIEDARRSVILDYSYQNLKNREILSLSHLGELITNLEKIKVVLTDPFVTETLQYADGFENRSQILNILSNRHLIRLDVLTNFVHPNDMSWVYDLPLSQMIEPKDGANLFSSIIQYDASNCAFKILTTCESRYSISINKALESEKADNETRKLFVVFSGILTTEDNFNSKSIKYENMAILLKHYFEDYDRNHIDAAKIIDIVTNERYEEQAQYIETVYNNLKDYHKSLFQKVVNTLFIYNNSPSAHMDYINYNKVIKQYSEYKKNLNINELIVMDSLLKTLVLIYEDKETIVTKVFTNIQSMIENDFKGILSVKDLVFERKSYVGRTVLKQISKRNMLTLKRVLNHVENGRLGLDRIINI